MHTTDPPLPLLRRQYYALVPPYLLRLPPCEIFASAENQKYLVGSILEDPEFQNRQPEASYRKGFWRKVVSELEEGVKAIHKDDPSSEAEVDEKLYGVLAELMAVPSASESSSLPSSYRTFIYDTPSWRAGEASTSNVTLLEEQTVLQAGTTGLRTWTAALHLAHHLLTDPSLLTGPDFPPVVELGAGTGFLSILLAQLGADVIATDLESGEDAQGPLPRLIENVRLNTTKPPVRVHALDWTDAALPDSLRPPIWRSLQRSTPPKTVIAADVIYDPSIIPPLVLTLESLLSPLIESPAKQAIIAATVRNESTLELFRQECASNHLSVEILDLPPMNLASPTFWDGGLDREVPVQVMRITAKI